MCICSVAQNPSFSQFDMCEVSAHIALQHSTEYKTVVETMAMRGNKKHVHQFIVLLWQIRGYEEDEKASVCSIQVMAGMGPFDWCAVFCV